jgi:hypothetical protein
MNHERRPAFTFTINDQPTTMAASEMILTETRRRELDELYGMIPKPTTYSSANIVLTFAQDTDMETADADEVVEIRQLVCHDRIFCELLRNDKTLSDMFWNWKYKEGGTWRPNSETEKEVTKQIEGAIRKRVDLVCRQKEYVSNCSIPLNKREDLQAMADKELGYMVQWMNEEKPGHRGLRIKIQKAFSIGNDLKANEGPSKGGY